MRGNILIGLTVGLYIIYMGWVYAWLQKKKNEPNNSAQTANQHFEVKLMHTLAITIAGYLVSVVIAQWFASAATALGVSPSKKGL